MEVSTEINVVTRLKHAAERVPDRAAFVTGEGSKRQTTTFAGLWERVDKVSTGLVREGLKPGERVILMVPMSVELYAAMLGVLKMGGVAVFVDPWITRRQIAGFAAFAEPAAYVGVFKSHLIRLFEKRLRRIGLTVTAGKRIGWIPAHRTLAELESADGDGVIHPVSADDPALVTFTTGSSGMPKGANRTHHFLAAQHEALRAEFPYRDADVDLSTFPVFALNNLATGITTVLPHIDFRKVAQAEPNVLERQMKRCGVTTCTASPPVFDRLCLLEKPPALRRIITGGAPVSDGQLRAWRSAFPETEIVVVYGSTEAEPVAHITADERLKTAGTVRTHARGYCVGRINDRVRVNIIGIRKCVVDLSDREWRDVEVPPGSIGEIVVTGDHICKEYYRNPTAVAENKIIDDTGTVWHRMGDVGYLDEERRFWLVGRVHSTIEIDGRFWHPEVIEQTARSADENVERAAVVAAEGGGHGLTVALQMPRRCDKLSKRTACERVTAALSEDGVPVNNVMVYPGPLPVDPRHNAKIDYEAVRRRIDRE